MGAAQSSSAQAQTTRESIDEKRDRVAELSSSISNLSVHSGTPISADGSLTSSTISQWESSIASNPKLTLTRSILNHSDLRSTLQSRSAAIADAHVFNLELEFKTNPITNQKSSGRCWLFATTNVLRYNVMKKLNLEEFELSQSYLYFWDKLNKCNYFLENIIETAGLPIDERIVYELTDEPISDGGQWDMVVNLLETYGVVPKAAFPESYHSSLSSPMNTLLKTKLREHALILRNLHSSLSSSSTSSSSALATLRAKKEDLMKEIYTIVSSILGVPPSKDEKFVWDYYDKEGKVGRWEGTPLEFYKKLAVDKYSPADSFSLINDPRNEYSKLYTVDRLGNLWGKRPVLYVNTEIDNLKKAIVTMLKAGQPVFFGCDVGQFSDRTFGIMDTDLFQYEFAFDISLSLTKADRLRTGESQMTHAMVISGVHIDPTTNKILRYKVENSWGPDAGQKGFYVMSDKWFDQFVYQVVIPKSLAPKELVKVYESPERTVLPLWDPMGSLA
ncbi:Cysteine proteinase 1, mitochondrial [Abortiporus biennis]